MKVLFSLVICSLLANITYAGFFDFFGVTSGSIGLECMGISQLYNAIKYLCANRDDQELWGKVIACHRPLTDEFMRASGEAQCPRPYNVQYSNDTSNSIEDVFFNICGVVDGGWLDFGATAWCVISGDDEPYIMSHREEVRRVKEEYPNLPCQIGECIVGLNIPDPE